MANPTKGTKKKSEANIEKLQVELTLKNTEMIKSSIKMAHITSRLSGIGPEGIMTSVILAVCDFIYDMAKALEVPRERIMKDLLDYIRDYVSDDSNFEQEVGN